MAQPVIAGVRQAAVGLVDHCDPTVLRRQCVTHRAAVIGAAVIHDEHFQRHIRLRQHRADTALHIVPDVVHRDHDREQALAHRFFIPHRVFPPSLLFDRKRVQQPAQGVHIAPVQHRVHHKEQRQHPQPKQRTLQAHHQVAAAIAAVKSQQVQQHKAEQPVDAQPHKIAHRRLSQHFGPGKKDQRRIAVQVRRQCAEQAARDAEPQHRHHRHQQVDAHLDQGLLPGLFKAAADVQQHPQRLLGAGQQLHRREQHQQAGVKVLGIGHTGRIQRDDGHQEHSHGREQCKGRGKVKGIVQPVQPLELFRLHIEQLPQPKTDAVDDRVEQLFDVGEKQHINGVHTGRRQTAQAGDQDRVGVVEHDARELMHQHRAALGQRLQIGGVVRVEPRIVFAHIGRKHQHLEHRRHAVGHLHQQDAAGKQQRQHAQQVARRHGGRGDVGDHIVFAFHFHKGAVFALHQIAHDARDAVEHHDQAHGAVGQHCVDAQGVQQRKHHRD